MYIQNFSNYINEAKKLTQAEGVLHNREYIDNGQASLEYEDNDFLVVRCLTQESMDFYGEKTQWETLSKKDKGKDKFNEYKDYLSIIIDKNLTKNKSKSPLRLILTFIDNDVCVDMNRDSACYIFVDDKYKALYNHFKINKKFKNKKKLQFYEINDDELLSKYMESIQLYKNLERLEIILCKIDKIPSHVYNLKTLKELVIKDTNVSKIESEIGKLVNLEHLQLSSNKINEIPKELNKLTNLKDLHLEYNPIEIFPDELTGLTSLDSLFLQGCKLTDVNDSIADIKNLRYLEMDSNQITSITDRIGELENLEVLRLWDNDIKTLPKSMSKLKQLNTLALRDNPNLKLSKEEIAKMIPNENLDIRL